MSTSESSSAAVQGTSCCKGAAAADCCKTSGAESSTQSSGGGGGCCGGGCGGGRSVPSVLTQPMTAEQMTGLPTLTLIARYRRGIEVIDRRVFDLTERQVDQAFLPEANVGRWPVRVLIGHCADAEVAWVHRMRRAVAEDRPMVASWDEDAFVDSNIYGNSHEGYSDNAEGDSARVMHALGGHLAVIHTLRQWTAQWLMSLDESAFDRSVMHAQRGEITLRRMVADATWHLEHHAGYLTRKVERMLGVAV
jgi:hypothetical protein